MMLVYKLTSIHPMHWYRDPGISHATALLEGDLEIPKGEQKHGFTSAKCNTELYSVSSTHLGAYGGIKETGYEWKN